MPAPAPRSSPRPSWRRGWRRPARERRARPAGGDGRAARRGERARSAELAADPAPPDDVADAAAAIPPATLACLIYTSGTGGAPKGVMLPHRCLLANCRGAFDLLRPLRLHDEVYLSFLPMSHSYEHTRRPVLPAQHRHRDRLRARRRAPRRRHAGGAADDHDGGAARAGGDPRPHPGPGGAPAGLAAGPVRPRARGRAPRGWRGAQACSTARSTRCSTGWCARRSAPASAAGSARRCRGGARLEPEVGQFFRALGIELLQGYGQTEAGPVISGQPARRDPHRDRRPPAGGRRSPHRR